LSAMIPHWPFWSCPADRADIDFEGLLGGMEPKGRLDDRLSESGDVLGSGIGLPFRRDRWSGKRALGQSGIQEVIKARGGQPVAGIVEMSILWDK